MNNIRTKKTRQTFTLPEDTFLRFASVVPEGKRSSTVARLLEEEAKRQEDVLARACQAANKNTGLHKLEKDFQALEDTVLEPFDPHAW
jgi:hypothetical protein